MKIVGLQSNNIKRLKAVELSFDENGRLIIVSGKNAQGKTSLIDSIWMVLGGKKAIPNKPIREGEESAEITLEVKGEKLSFIAKRRFTEKDTYLTITNSEGAKFSNPQEMLDTIIGNLSFDPLAFTRLLGKDQVKQLMQITGLNFDELDAEVKELRSERTTVGRMQKTYTPIAEDQLAEVQKLSATPEVSVTELSHKYQTLSKQKDDFDRAQTRILQIDEQIKALQAEKVELQKVELPTENPETIKTQIDSADATNKTIREAKSKLENHNNFLAKKKEYDDMSATIKEKEDSKAKALSEAKMPIEGLSWDEEGVKFNNIPFDQLSGAEQLKVSMAIAMASSPHLRVILIKDGSLLDKDGLSVIESMAKEKDFQVWLEVVDDTGEVGIYIEDGEIKKINQ